MQNGNQYEYDTGTFKVKQGNSPATRAYLWRQYVNVPSDEVWALLPAWEPAGSAGWESLHLDRLESLDLQNAAEFRSWVLSEAGYEESDIRFHLHEVRALPAS
jgi:hypothetical protein